MAHSTAWSNHLFWYLVLLLSSTLSLRSQDRILTMPDQYITSTPLTMVASAADSSVIIETQISGDSSCLYRVKPAVSEVELLAKYAAIGMPTPHIISPDAHWHVCYDWDPNQPAPRGLSIFDIVHKTQYNLGFISNAESYYLDYSAAGSPVQCTADGGYALVRLFNIVNHVRQEVVAIVELQSHEVIHYVCDTLYSRDTRFTLLDLSADLTRGTVVFTYKPTADSTGKLLVHCISLQSEDQGSVSLDAGFFTKASSSFNASSGLLETTVWSWKGWCRYSIDAVSELVVSRTVIAFADLGIRSDSIRIAWSASGERIALINIAASARTNVCQLFVINTESQVLERAAPFTLPCDLLCFGSDSRRLVIVSGSDIVELRNNEWFTYPLIIPKKRVVTQLTDRRVSVFFPKEKNQQELYAISSSGMIARWEAKWTYDSAHVQLIRPVLYTFSKYPPTMSPDCDAIALNGYAFLQSKPELGMMPAGDACRFFRSKTGYMTLSEGRLNKVYVPYNKYGVETADIDAVDFDLSPDNAHIVVALRKNEIRVFNSYNFPFSNVLGTSPSAVKAIAYSPDGEHVAERTEDGLILVWNSRACTISDQIIFRRYTAFCFSPDSRFLYIGSEDSVITTWSLPDHYLVCTNRCSIGAPYTMSCSSNGEWICAGNTQGHIALWTRRSLSAVEDDAPKTSDSMRLYPQPVHSNTLSVDVSAFPHAQYIQVYNITGQLLQTHLCSELESVVELDLSTMTNGVYECVIQSLSSRRSNMFVLQR